MSLSAETRDFLDNLLRENPVVLFMKGNRVQPQCGFSARTVAALDMLLPDYMAIDVLQHPELREGIKAYGNWPTVPQLYVRGELVGGCDIVTEMFASGELAQALGVPVPPVADPRIELEPAAEAIMQNALAGNPGMAVHLKIDAGWDHSLSLAPSRPDNRRVRSGAVSIELDPWSAGRADGLKIQVQESLRGQGFAFDNPNAPPPVTAVSVEELRAELDRGERVHLFDVRSDEERAVAALPAAAPWDEAAMHAIDQLPKDAPLTFMCHKGGRSRAVAERYRRRGYTRVRNLDGGIDAWSNRIDPAIPRY